MTSDKYLVNPLCVGFSQGRLRTVFRDGMVCTETADEIIYCKTKPEWNLPFEYILLTPYEDIHIVGLRTKNRLYGNSNDCIYLHPWCWYTLDNRRLFTLQLAALRVWPARVGATCLPMTDVPGSTNQIKKFKTPDQGRSIHVRSACTIYTTAVHRQNESWSWVHAIKIHPATSDPKNAVKIIEHLESIEAKSMDDNIEAFERAPSDIPSYLAALIGIRAGTSNCMLAVDTGESPHEFVYTYYSRQLISPNQRIRLFLGKYLLAALREKIVSEIPRDIATAPKSVISWLRTLSEASRTKSCLRQLIYTRSSLPEMETLDEKYSHSDFVVAAWNEEFNSLLTKGTGSETQCVQFLCSLLTGQLSYPELNHHFQSLIATLNCIQLHPLNYGRVISREILVARLMEHWRSVKAQIFSKKKPSSFLSRLNMYAYHPDIVFSQEELDYLKKCNYKPYLKLQNKTILAGSDSEDMYYDNVRYYSPSLIDSSLYSSDDSDSEFFSWYNNNISKHKTPEILSKSFRLNKVNKTKDRFANFDKTLIPYSGKRDLIHLASQMPSNYSSVFADTSKENIISAVPSLQDYEMLLLQCAFNSEYHLFLQIFNYNDYTRAEQIIVEQRFPDLDTHSVRRSDSRRLSISAPRLRFAAEDSNNICTTDYINDDKISHQNKKNNDVFRIDNFNSLHDRTSHINSISSFEETTNSSLGNNKFDIDNLYNILKSKKKYNNSFFTNLMSYENNGSLVQKHLKTNITEIDSREISQTIGKTPNLIEKLPKMKSDFINSNQDSIISNSFLAPFNFDCTDVSRECSDITNIQNNTLTRIMNSTSHDNSKKLFTCDNSIESKVEEFNLNQSSQIKSQFIQEQSNILNKNLDTNIYKNTNKLEMNHKLNKCKYLACSNINTSISSENEVTIDQIDSNNILYKTPYYTSNNFDSEKFFQNLEKNLVYKSIDLESSNFPIKIKPDHLNNKDFTKLDKVKHDSLLSKTITYKSQEILKPKKSESSIINNSLSLEKPTLSTERNDQNDTYSGNKKKFVNSLIFHNEFSNTSNITLRDKTPQSLLPNSLKNNFSGNYLSDSKIFKQISQPQISKNYLMIDSETESDKKTRDLCEYIPIAYTTSFQNIEENMYSDIYNKSQSYLSGLDHKRTHEQDSNNFYPKKSIINTNNTKCNTFSDYVSDQVTMNSDFCLKKVDYNKVTQGLYDSYEFNSTYHVDSPYSEIDEIHRNKNFFYLPKKSFITQLSSKAPCTDITAYYNNETHSLEKLSYIENEKSLNNQNQLRSFELKKPINQSISPQRHFDILEIPSEQIQNHSSFKSTNRSIEKSKFEKQSNTPIAIPRANYTPINSLYLNTNQEFINISDTVKKDIDLLAKISSLHVANSKGPELIFAGGCTFSQGKTTESSACTPHERDTRYLTDPIKAMPQRLRRLQFLQYPVMCDCPLVVIDLPFNLFLQMPQVKEMYPNVHVVYNVDSIPEHIWVIVAKALKEGCWSKADIKHSRELAENLEINKSKYPIQASRVELPPGCETVSQAHMALMPSEHLHVDSDIEDAGTYLSITMDQPNSTNNCTIKTRLLLSGMEN